jgi:Mce-associated membrane protein
MEGDAGAGQLNPTLEPLEDDSDEQSPTTATEETTGQDVDESAQQRRQERLGRGWMAAICVGLLVLAGGVTAGGYLALRWHETNTNIARQDALAVQAAKDCVAATHAPDSAAMEASQTKIIDCSTGDFGAQATLYSGMLVDVYQAANVSVKVSDMRAAVERHNDDGTIDVLVAVRVKVTNSETAGQEQGYRLRVKMQPADGTYKVARLDQVTS